MIELEIIYFKLFLDKQEIRSVSSNVDTNKNNNNIGAAIASTTATINNNSIVSQNPTTTNTAV